MFSVVSVGVSVVSAGVFVVAAEVSVVSFMFFQLNASFNPVWITLFFNSWYAPTIILPSFCNDIGTGATLLTNT